MLCIGITIMTKNERTKLARKKDPERFRKTYLNYYLKNKDKIREKRRAYYFANKLRCKAHMAVNSELRAGRMFKQPCEKCGLKAEAHHDDYNKPLDVRWLCKRHHAEHHLTADGAS